MLMPPLQLHYNIAPGSSILTVRDTEEGRRGVLARWGFIPSWAKDPAAMPMLNNARGEGISDKPMFRRAMRRRRCLIPASGFYEWKAVPGQRSKQPFYFSLHDGSPMAFAGIWETAKMADGEAVDTCAIITTQANAVVEPVHIRMPVIVPPSGWSTWLSADIEDEQRLAAANVLIAPYAAEGMQAWGVAHAVNKVINNSPALLQPIA